MWSELGFNAEDTILQKTTFTFDVSVWGDIPAIMLGNQDGFMPERR